MRFLTNGRVNLNQVFRPPLPKPRRSLLMKPDAFDGAVTEVATNLRPAARSAVAAAENL